MPGFLLNVSTPVLCSHGGQAKPTVPNPRVKIMGQPSVTLGPPYVVAGCPLPPVAGGPCIIANWAVAATRVRVMGMPVLLTDSQAICAPTGVPVAVIPGQVRVRGM